MTDDARSGGDNEATNDDGTSGSQDAARASSSRRFALTSLLLLDLDKEPPKLHTIVWHTPLAVMLLRSNGTLSLQHAITYGRPLHSITRPFATKRPGGEDEAELAAARRWLSQLDPDIIPRDICDVSFSRSSGPGGQNVNK